MTTDFDFSSFVVCFPKVALAAKAGKTLKDELQIPERIVMIIPQKNSRIASFLEKLSFDNLYSYIK